MKSLADYLNATPVPLVASLLDSRPPTAPDGSVAVVGRITGRTADHMIVDSGDKRLIVVSSDVTGVEEGADDKPEDQGSRQTVVYVRASSTIGELRQRRAVDFNQMSSIPLVFAMPSDAHRYAVEVQPNLPERTVSGAYATPRESLATRTGQGYDDSATDNVTDWSDSD
jgi:hypothetical protein